MPLSQHEDFMMKYTSGDVQNGRENATVMFSYAPSFLAQGILGVGFLRTRFFD
jgi:hypothetical protein